MTSPISPDVIYKLRNVGDPALSPDGGTLAYTLSWVDAQEMEGRSRIMLMTLDSGQTMEFTQGTQGQRAEILPRRKHPRVSQARRRRQAAGLAHGRGRR